MMPAHALTPEQILRNLAERGITLTLDGDHLRYQGPAGALDASLRAGIAHQRPAIIALLNGAQDSIPLPPDMPATLQHSPSSVPIVGVDARIAAQLRVAPRDAPAGIAGQGCYTLARPVQDRVAGVDTVAATPCATRVAPHSAKLPEIQAGRDAECCSVARKTERRSGCAPGARPRMASDMVAALPHAPCHGGCGQLTPHGWYCKGCIERMDAGERQ